jgi:hypothetical protein
MSLADGSPATSAAVGSDATAAAVAEVFHQLNTVRQEPATPDELAVAAEALSRSMISRFDTAASSAASVGELFIPDLDADQFSGKFLLSVSYGRVDAYPGKTGLRVRVRSAPPYSLKCRESAWIVVKTTAVENRTGVLQPPDCPSGTTTSTP